MLAYKPRNMILGHILQKMLNILSQLFMRPTDLVLINALVILASLSYLILLHLDDAYLVMVCQFAVDGVAAKIVYV